MNTHKTPLVSVIMPIHNGLPYLNDAIRSVVYQTYTNLEIIIIDDCSDDDTYDCIYQWAKNDSRILLLKSENNLGIGGARDIGIQHAHGQYIAFMDADDISYQIRIEEQVKYLKEYTGIVAVGVQTNMIDSNGNHIGEKKFPIDSVVLKQMLYLYAPMQIPTVMVQKSLIPENFKWFEGWRYGEDTLLFFKLLQFGELSNVDQKLYAYRQHKKAVSSTNAKDIFNNTWKARQLGRQKYEYKASFKMRLISYFQFFTVKFIPSSLLNSFYTKIRKKIQKISGHEK